MAASDSAFARSDCATAEIDSKAARRVASAALARRSFSVWFSLSRAWATPQSIATNRSCISRLPSWSARFAAACTSGPPSAIARLTTARRSSRYGTRQPDSMNVPSSAASPSRSTAFAAALTSGPPAAFISFTLARRSISLARAQPPSRNFATAPGSSEIRAALAAADTSGPPRALIRPACSRSSCAVRRGNWVRKAQIAASSPSSACSAAGRTFTPPVTQASRTTWRSQAGAAGGSAAVAARTSPIGAPMRSSESTAPTTPAVFQGALSHNARIAFPPFRSMLQRGTGRSARKADRPVIS